METASPKINECDIFNNKGAGVKWITSQSLKEWAESSQETIEYDKRWHEDSIRIFFRSAGGKLCECLIHHNKENGMALWGRSEPKIEKCKIYENKTEGDNYPGVVVSGFASPKIKDCEIFNHLDCGIWLQSSAQGVYENCDIYNNVEEGVYIQDSAKGLFNECDIHDNKGNGLFVDGDSTPKVVKSKIYDNMVENDSYPGVIVSENASPEFDDCEIFNHASYGIWLRNQSQGVYSKCDIHDNEEEGVYIQDVAKGVFSECRVYDNKKRGILITDKSSPEFENCSVHDNVGDEEIDHGFYSRKGSSPLITGCEVYNQKIGVFLTDCVNGECIKCDIHDNIVGVGAKKSVTGLFCESRIHHNNGKGFVIMGGSTLKVKKCVIHDNNAEEKECSGIVIKDDAKPEISECEIYNHRGYGICENGEPRLGLNCNIHDNGEENLKY